jgi:hypothetical protein
MLFQVAFELIAYIAFYPSFAILTLLV